MISTCSFDNEYIKTEKKEITAASKIPTENNKQVFVPVSKKIN
jgi:hypothetical protein